jgi:hypothetical protein
VSSVGYKPIGYKYKTFPYLGTIALDGVRFAFAAVSVGRTPKRQQRREDLSHGLVFKKRILGLGAEVGGKEL